MNATDFLKSQGITLPFNATGTVRIPCVFCDHTRAKHKGERCLFVNAETGGFFCHHCGRRPEASRVTHIFTPIKPTGPVDSHFSTPAISFLEDRGIPIELAQAEGVFETVRYLGGSAKPALGFPYVVDGSIVNIKYRAIESKDFGQEKGADKAFYRVDSLKDSKEAIICEGELDALAFAAAGLKVAVSLPDGAIGEKDVLAEGKLRALDNCIDRFDGVEAIYLACDADPHGERTNDELARRLGRDRCYRVRFPVGCKDANDVLKLSGTAGVVDLILDAEPWPVEGVFSANDIFPDLLRLYQVGYPKGVKLGIWGLDRLFEWHTGQFSVVTGVPGHQKSSFFDQVAVKLIVRAMWRWAYFTPEHWPLEAHLHRMVEQLTGRCLLQSTADNVKGAVRMSEAGLREAMAFLGDRVHYIHPKDSAFTLDMILANVEVLVKRYGVRGVTIDPWNKLEHHRPKGESETEFIGRVLNRMKDHAREWGYHCILIAHPTKMKVHEASGRVYEPGLYDISGSSNWANVADNGFTVYRNFGEPDAGIPDQTDVSVKKVKHSYYGRTGRVHFEPVASCHRFYEVGQARWTGSELDPDHSGVEAPLWGIAGPPEPDQY